MSNAIGTGRNMPTNATNNNENTPGSKSNIVFITTKADSYGKPVTLMYSITHLTYKKIDFIAPELSLKTDGESGIEYEKR